jgi:hypothetical protein
MNLRKTIVSVVAAVALSAAIAGPVVAGPPTYTGSIQCLSGEIEMEFEHRTDWTKKMIAAAKKTSGVQDCDKGSIVLVMTKN